MSFLDVVSDVVATAGRRTAATSTRWQTWAWQVEQKLRDGPAAAHNGVVRTAGEAYVEAWNQRLHRVAVDADELGGNTVSGSNVVANADTESTRLLTTQGAVTAENHSGLLRQI